MTYLDHASTVPLHPAAREVLLAAHDEGWADPARLYGSGRRARLLLDDARARVAGAFGVRPDEVTFLASGTAAVHAALAGTLAARARVGAHLVTSAVEHSAVRSFAEQRDATMVGASRTGRVDPGEFAAAVREDTAVASLQHANHEVGTLQPLAEVAAACAERGIPLHTDAAASAGRVAVETPALLTASAHKWGGPPGVGVLVVRKGIRWRAPFADGFPNVPAIVAAAVALEAVVAERDAEAARLSALVDRIRAEVPARVEDVEVVGEPVDRLPHVVTFSCLYVDGEALVTELDRRGFAVNSGSSCGTESGLPSPVLEAMGVLTHGNVRVSLGRDTTGDDVTRFLDAVVDVVRDVRSAL
ncbi:MAG TPA: aminotransferase class V-fold PLP-dependent enzyme [Frankiaceae bacterium]|nr:aminotransferase class V-fold PLP-dependent enzyme [Frankiaceae bacterium]